VTANTTTDPAIDAYLAELSAEQRDLLLALRRTIHELVPEAVETISYGMPAFKVDGKALIWFAAWKRHCSVYPVGPGFLATHPELAGHGHSDKGALHFSAEKPLPSSVVEDLVRDRLRAVANEPS